MKAQNAKDWWNVIGLRADEPRRVSRKRANPDLRMGMAGNFLPLADAGVTKMDVKRFWDAQDFDLRLPNINGVTPLGNCDLCFLKGAKTIAGIIRDHPELAIWWAEAEAEERASAPNGAVFRMDRPPYRNLIEMTQQQGDFFMDWPDEPTIPCGCHD
ncbi:MAG: hypothetical protein HQL36_03020 [Alphaproteobacteria bacterium]|nr:hypothetical protein [Alphaproteobacteria bacterium]